MWMLYIQDIKDSATSRAADDPNWKHSLMLVWCKYDHTKYAFVAQQPFVLSSQTQASLWHLLSGF